MPDVHRRFSSILCLFVFDFAGNFSNLQQWESTFVPETFIDSYPYRQQIADLKMLADSAGITAVVSCSVPQVESRRNQLRQPLFAPLFAPEIEDVQSVVSIGIHRNRQELERAFKPMWLLPASRRNSNGRKRAEASRSGNVYQALQAGGRGFGSGIKAACDFQCRIG